VESIALGNEVVFYAIIHTPGININASANTVYAMDCNLHSNYVYNAKVWDAFARSLGDGQGSCDVNEAMKYVHGGFIQRLITSPYNPLNYLPEPRKGTRLGDVFNKVKQLYANHKSWIDPLANAAAARFGYASRRSPQHHLIDCEDDKQYLDVQHASYCLI